MEGKRVFTMTDDPFYNLDNVVSSTESTGIIPSLHPHNDPQNKPVKTSAGRKQKADRNKKY